MNGYFSIKQLLKTFWGLVLNKLKPIQLSFLNHDSYSMLVSVVGMALYTGYVFMPQHIMAILHYFEIVQ